MNSTTHSILAAACILAGSIQFSPAADASNGFFDNVAARISAFEAKNCEIEYMKVGFVGRKGSCKCGVELQKNVNYHVFVCGHDVQISDVDLAISAEDNLEKEIQDSGKNLIEIEMSTTRTQVFTYNISAAQMHPDCKEGMFALIIARDCDPAELNSAKPVCKQISQWLGQWSQAEFYSCTINRITRDGVTTRGSYFDDTDYTIVGLGDGGSLLDLDVALFDSADKVIASDDTDANTGVIKFSPLTSGKHSIQWKPSRMKKGATHGHIAYLLGGKRKAAPQTAAN